MKSLLRIPDKRTSRRDFLKVVGVGASLGVAAKLAGIRLEETPILGQKVITIGPSKALASGVADYVCNGSQDNVQLQAALDALPSIGGKLVVLAGIYNFTAIVSRAIDDVVIQGVGFGTLFNNDGATALFDIGSQDGWVFRDLATDAGGIDYSSATRYTLENVREGSAFRVLYPHTATLDAHTKNMYELLRTPAYALGMPAASYNSIVAVSTNRMLASPFLVSRDLTVTQLAAKVHVAAGAGKKMRFGIYTNLGGGSLYPGTLVVDGGEVAADATVVVSAIINELLSTALYWLVVLMEESASLIHQPPAFPILGMNPASFNSVYGSWYITQAYGALPDPCTLGGAVNAAGQAVNPYVADLN